MFHKITNTEEEKWEERTRFGGEGIQNEGLDKSLPSLMAMLPIMVLMEGKFDGDDGWEWKCENENEKRGRETILTMTM